MGDLSLYNRTVGSKDSETVLCCVCGKPAKPYALDYNGNSIGRCPRCGLRFVSPRPPMGALLTHTYDAAYYGLTGKDRKEASQDCSTHLSRLHRFAAPPGRLLDIGAGDGSLLKAAIAGGWSAEGVEMHPMLYERYLKDIGCPIHLGRFEGLGFKARYDAVTMIHVLEHVQDPKAFLARCSRALRPGGAAYAVVPNTASFNDRVKTALSRWRLKSRPWKHFAADHHLWFFTPETLSRLCEAAGFEVLRLAAIHPRPGTWPGAALFQSTLGRAVLAPWLCAVLGKPR
ncbi:MAG: class I SAM-dependent methyltransferase [Elusimicrobia bacterium]|nr:class I SAM-dependent methyltransferase [Elusimicrobiota bacterium]